MNSVVEAPDQGAGIVLPAGASVPDAEVPADLVEQPMPCDSPAVPDELSVFVQIREARSASALARRVLDDGRIGRERWALLWMTTGGILMMIAGVLALLS